MHEYLLYLLDDFLHCLSCQFPQDGYEPEYWKIDMILILLFEGRGKQ